MKRAESFVLSGRGHWARASSDFLCDHKGPCGPCLAPVKKGESYLSTTISKFPDVKDNDRRRFVKLRYCFHCADQELPGNELPDSRAVLNVSRLDRSRSQADNSNSCK